MIISYLINKVFRIKIMGKFGQKGLAQLNKLAEKNLKLENELLFANKCIKTLIIFKSFVNFICNKLKNNLSPKEWEMFEKYQKDVQEVFKSKDKLNEQTTKSLTQILLSSEDVIDIEEDNGGTGSNSGSSNSALQQSLNSTNEKSAQNEINSSDGNKTIGNTIHSTDESKKTSIETTNSGKEMPLYERLFKSNIMNDKLAKNEIKSYDGINSNKSIHSSEENMSTKKTLLSHKELPSKPLYKSNITYNRKRKKSNKCSQNTDKKVNKSIETTEEMTDPTTTQTIKTEIISNNKNEENSENIKFQYLSQNLKNIKNTNNSLNLSKSQLSTKAPNNEQNIDLIDTNDGSEEQTNSGSKSSKCLGKRQKFVDNQLEGPIIVDINPLNSSTDPKLISVFKCPIIECYKWMSIDFIPNHSQEIHNQFVVICVENKCKKVFTSSVKYDEHMTRNHPKDTNDGIEGNDCKNSANICDICGKEFLNKYRMNDHKHFVHVLKPHLECEYPGCETKFKIRSNLNYHMSTVHSSVDLKLECNKCNKVFKHQRALKFHKMSVHSEKRFSCNWPGCQYWSNHKSHFKKHQTTHTTERKYVCDWPECGKAYKVRDYLRAHMKIHSKTDVLVCDWPGCQYTCVMKSSLTSHQSVHSTERKFVCDWPECGKAFRRADNLRSHMKIHTRDNLYSCDWPGCEFKTAYSKNITRHLKRIHEKE